MPHDVNGYTSRIYRAAKARQEGGDALNCLEAATVRLLLVDGATAL